MSWRGAAARAVGAVGALLFAPAAASAQPRPARYRPPVAVQVDGCLSPVRDEVLAITLLELGARAVPSEAQPAETTRVELRCAPRAIAIRVEDPITGKVVEREVDLSTVAPRARARLLALAIAELVATSWSELLSAPAPVLPPPGVRPAPQVRQAVRELMQARASRAQVRFRVLAVGAVHGFVTPGGPALFGGGVRAGIDAPGPWSVALDVVGSHGVVAAPDGAVDVSTVAASAAVGVRAQWPVVALRAAAGVRAGAAWVTGLSNATAIGQSVVGPWGGPLVALGASLAPVRGLVIELCAEGGYALASVVGLLDGRREAAVDGAWVGATLGVGVAP